MRLLFSSRDLVIRLFCVVSVIMLVAMLALPAMAQTKTDLEVQIINPHGVLSSSDEQVLKEQTSKIQFPEEVERVVYYVVKTNKDNFNIEIKEYAFHTDQSLLDESKNKFAPGLVIAGVGLDPRRNGLYCGDDVCTAMNIFEGRHLDHSLDAMKPAFRRENYAVGLIEGLRVASDPSLTPAAAQGDSEVSSETFLFLGLGLFAAMWGVIGSISFFARIKNARKAYQHLRNSLGSVALELDEVNVRANSLSSPLANTRLRNEWDKVLTNFLEIRETTKLVESWERNEPSVWQLYKHSKTLVEADDRVVKLETAQRNINELFEMEQGNTDVRQAKLFELELDITEAIAASTSDNDREDLKAIKAKVVEMETLVDLSDFMTRYARVLAEYQSLLEGIAKRVYGTKDIDYAGPAIYDNDWRVGMGYNNWIPYTILYSNHSSWGQSDWESSSDWAMADVDFGSGFDGGSFSGGGGSSSW